MVAITSEGSGQDVLSVDLRERYKTPETEPTLKVCRLLNIPDDSRLIAAVSEVLGWLTNPDVWEEVGVTPDLAAALATEVVVYEECAAMEDARRVFDVYYVVNDGSDGLSVPVGTPTKLPYNTTGVNEDSASMSLDFTTGVLTLSPGRYTVEGSFSVANAGLLEWSLGASQPTNLSRIPLWRNNRFQAGEAEISFRYHVEVAQTTDVWLELYAQNAVAKLGEASARPNADEVYADLWVTRWGEVL